MKRIAIIQSCYVPWRGFFDLVSRCDEYVIYDQAAYSKGHWHNRNLIPTHGGLRWMTIPVISHDRLGQPIEDVEIAAPWAERHWRLLEQAYARAAGFEQVAPGLRLIYEEAARQRRLTDINEMFLRALIERLGIDTQITRDHAYRLHGARSERVLSACLCAGATHYLSGPSARAYLDLALFAEAGVCVEWMDYGAYPDYSQPHPPFVGEVSVLDLLFNTGLDAPNYLHPSEGAR